MELSPISHGLWDQLLKKVVIAKGVDYLLVQKNITLLDQYLDLLKGVADPENRPHEEKLALFINAYNAFTLKLITNHFPVKSIKDIPSKLSWPAKMWSIGSTTYSLDDIEHQILRKMEEPRIHFALNCASRSCPPLPDFAMEGDEIEKQLDQLTRDFFKDSENLFIGDQPGFIWGIWRKLKLSKILKWYEKDFLLDSKTIVEFIFPFLEEGAKNYLKKYEKKISISYFSYDWSLNLPRKNLGKK